MTLTATSSHPAVARNLVITGSGATRTLSFVIPPFVTTGTADITVTADDGQADNHVFSRTFTVIVR